MKTPEQIKEKFYDEFPPHKLDETPMEGVRAMGFLECVDFMTEGSMEDFVNNYKKIVLMKLVRTLLDDISKE